MKADPRDVVLATIDGPSSPFSTSTANDTSICGPGTSSCTVLDHSCSDSMNAGFFADPAVRINTLVDAVPNHLRASVCETDDASAVDALAQRINSARLEDVCPP